VTGAVLTALTWVSLLAATDHDRAPSPDPTPRPPSAGPVPTPPPRDAQPYVIAAAGDIACDGPPAADPASSVCRYGATAALLAGVDHVLTLGDNQYPSGELEAYRRWYGPTWGRFRDVTSPAPGNHEYLSGPGGEPTGYLAYFGDRVRGPGGLGSYSFDLPPGCTPGEGVCWHVVAIASEPCFEGGGCGPSTGTDLDAGARLYRWLEQDLAVHPNEPYPCTLAFWHHPLFSFSTGSGASSTVRPLWELLYRARAEIVLNGHSHNYQRWDPLTPDGTPDPAHGIREFVVGTGGARLYALPEGPRPSALAAAQDRAFGVLRLTLLPTSYAWAWVGVDRGADGFSDTADADVACA
jgi:hypothetical protein